jgi:hypothetical protein
MKIAHQASRLAISRRGGRTLKRPTVSTDEPQRSHLCCSACHWPRQSPHELLQATISINRRAPINDVTLVVLHARYVETIEISLRYRTRDADLLKVRSMMTTGGMTMVNGMVEMERQESIYLSPRARIKLQRLEMRLRR